MFGLLRKKKIKEKKTEQKKKALIVDRLIYEGYRFSFTKAIDWSLKVSGLTLDDISVSGKLNFQSKYTDVYTIEGIKDGVPEITVNINGMFGIEGHLPDPYIENYILYNKNNKQAVLDFLNIFNQKILSLRYLYDKKQITECLSVPINKSLIGNVIYKISDMQDNASPSLPDQFRISSQNLFWRHTRSAESLRVMLSSFFDSDVEIEQFSGGFTDPISESETTKIGQNYNSLGKNTILGSKIWDSMQGIKIHVKSLNIEKYLEFLPAKSKNDNEFSKLHKMKEIIRMYIPIGIEAQIVFHLAETYIKDRRAHLGGISRLNKDMFISGQHVDDSTCFVESLYSH
ncbi:MAG: type VI secretion system baseplate subunit TssG [Holosporales bacterium]|jgi:type VI secretion system protein ImpH|nr:type VI secretion system baseplate subunit TssG [Holosporales bacterium]